MNGACSSDSILQEVSVSHILSLYLFVMDSLGSKTFKENCNQFNQEFIIRGESV